MVRVGPVHEAPPALPLQWPLVGRHEELDLFTATLADDRAHGFVIHGPAGVGKTRLADQCLALAADRAGRFVARATATEGSRPVPLGALAHLLPDGTAQERDNLVAVVSRVRAVLREQAVGGPLVLFVDDLHLLDGTSATLVGQLVDADLLFLVGTVRADARVPAGVDSLWQRARVRRIDLDDLDRAGIDTLLHLVLGGPVEARTVSEIWTASRGNLLFVRELVLGAVGDGHLVNQHGVWRLDGSLVATARLHELVDARLGELGSSAREALEVLAVCGPTGLAVLEDIVGREQLESLDRTGALAISADGRRQEVALAHPLYREMLRARVTPLRRRRLLLRHADGIEALGARRDQDVAAVANARLEATGSADPHLLVRAARFARRAGDFEQVERFGRSAVNERPSAECGLLVGEALHHLGRFAEAEEVLAATARLAADDLAADDLAADDLAVGADLAVGDPAAADLAAGADLAGRADLVMSDQPSVGDHLAVGDGAAALGDRAAREDMVVAVAEVRSRNLVVGLGRAGAALAVNAEAQGRLATGGSGVEELAFNEALLLTYAGRPSDTLAVLGRIGPPSTARARALRSLAEVPALAATGQARRAAELATEALAERARSAEAVGVPDGSAHVIARTYALLEAGLLATAEAEALAAYDAVGATAPPEARLLLSMLLGRAALLAGRVETALRWLNEALARGEEHHLAGPTRLVLSLLATAYAQAGDPAAAGDAADRADRLPGAAVAPADQRGGRAWALAAAGDLPAARAGLADAATLAAGGGYVGSEAALLHDVARLGDPSSVASRLEALAARGDGELLAAYAAHARAAAAGDGPALVAAADRFEALGALLLAAESATEAAVALLRRGDRRAATALGQRAARLAEACEGARTPGLTLPITVSPLTPRERDIATLAAQGRSSKDIAERLFLSVRTVDNHLQSVYSKLGIAGRHQLAVALDESRGHG